MKASELIVKCLENEGVDCIIDCPVDASENLRLTQRLGALAVPGRLPA